MFVDDRLQKIACVGRHELIADLLDLLWDVISQHALLACQRDHSEAPLYFLKVIDTTDLRETPKTSIADKGIDIRVNDRKALLKKADLPDIRFHDLRHSSATLLLSAGIHPKVVQEILGHSQISMTMDIYSHVLPNMQHEAMKKLNDMIGGQKKDDEDQGGRRPVQG